MWQLGIYLAKLAEAHDLAASMTVECYYHFLMNQDWDAAKELISELPDMKVNYPAFELFLFFTNVKFAALRVPAESARNGVQ